MHLLFYHWTAVVDTRTSERQHARRLDMEVDWVRVWQQ